MATILPPLRLLQHSPQTGFVRRIAIGKRFAAFHEPRTMRRDGILYLRDNPGAGMSAGRFVRVVGLESDSEWCNDVVYVDLCQRTQ